MIKVIVCVSKKTDLSMEEFIEHWQVTHRELLMKYQDVLKIKKHIQMLPDNAQLQAGLDMAWSKAPYCDGIDETWFESEEAFRELRNIPDAAKALQILREDEVKFVDHSKTYGWVVRDATIIG